MALVLDEPADKDKVEEVEGLRFLIDGDLGQRLAPYLPLQIDFDDRFWGGLRVRPFRGGRC